MMTTMEGEANGNVQALVTEVVSNEGQTAPALRAVFEAGGSDIKASDFIESLDGYSKRMSFDIEHMCNKYYQGFIESIDELLGLRDHSEDLREAVEETREGLDETAQDVGRSLEHLIEARTVHKNVLVTIDGLQRCRPVLKLYAKAQSQLAKKKFYATLKTLQELEEEELPRIKPYTFVRLIRKRIPAMRLQVKEVAFAEMRTFLASVRDQSPSIGAAAMAKTQTMQQETSADTTTSSSRLTTGTSVSATDSATFTPATTAAAAATATTTNSSSTSTTAPGELTDFSPIYRCLHIYGVLGVREECATYYRTERRKQAELVLVPTSQMTSSTGYREYLRQVAGFFIVEDTVLATTQKFLSPQWLEELWETALTTVARVIQSQLSRSATARMIEEVKALIVLFNQTLQRYGFNVSRLYGILIQVTERYVAVLQADCAAEFADILSEDNYTPLEVANEHAYAQVLAQFEFEDRVLREAPFPKSFPFSRAVPRLYTVVRRFIDSAVAFVRNLDLSQTEVDEMVRIATNRLLSKTMSGAMSKVIMESHLGLPQLTQISVNTTHLEASCSRLEEYISGHTLGVGEGIHETQLYGAATFKDARTAAEQKIFMVFQSQIDQFLGLAEYDWCPAKPKTRPSEHIYDLLAYLSTIFASLTNMPADVARSAYFDTCKYISGKLLAVVVSPEINRVNMNGIQTFAVDVETCEAYADNCPLVARGDTLFRDVFVRLRELVNLFINWDWAVYLKPRLRKQAYPHLRADIALAWLEKYDDTQRGRIIKNAGDRKKSKEVESILKQLRVLAAATNK